MLRPTKCVLRRSSLSLLALSVLAAPCFAQGTWRQEADRLSALLEWHAGGIVAEIGAGRGELTLEAAQRVGLSGKVYTTELPDNLAPLKELAAEHKNIVAIQAAEASTNLPPACCDSIFMRLVYHHLTKPADVDASIFRSLKPGGRLAVIDEPPAKGSTIPPGVPRNRLGHGIPQKILISELTTAGFKLEHIENHWPASDAYHPIYCVVFRKP
ncbi:MAG TPA: methyltransferase domain-containing protein [Candidatus Acidoferrales bacterium]|nr:methyltransferase domain-containing protein [Candidatus Acidoferrales bacterium]